MLHFPEFLLTTMTDAIESVCLYDDVKLNKAIKLVSSRVQFSLENVIFLKTELSWFLFWTNHSINNFNK